MTRTCIPLCFAALTLQLPGAEIPDALRVPAEQRLILHAHGQGAQIYTCTSDGSNYNWKLTGPDAKLTDLTGKAVGRHFAGPTWEAQDGSQVKGKVHATVPSPEHTAIPWLLLDATAHESQGVMTQVQSIQRIGTEGGLAPESGCDVSHTGSVVRIPYSAEYYFYGEVRKRN